MDSKEKSRREFLSKGLKSLGLCVAGISIAPILNSCEVDWSGTQSNSGIIKELDVSQEIRLSRVGSGVMKTYPEVNLGIPVIIVCIGESEFVCFSSLCTHESCYGEENITVPTPGREVIVCQCHGSRFDPFDGGKPIQEPAERPLKQFQTEFNKETNILKIYF